MPLKSSDPITLAHGNGGRFMRELIDEVFAKHLRNPVLDMQADAVPLTLDEGIPVMTTDGFTVKPLAFPGGDIGCLAVHGTVNDLAVAGAIPKYLTLNAFIEEGLTVAELDRYIASLSTAASASQVLVVAGDTKVLPRGEGSGLYLATTGIGLRPTTLDIGLNRISSGDTLIVSGSVGDHGTAVMLAREQFGLRGDLQSDTASVLPLCQALTQLPGLKFMRDPTRGGLATVANEIAAYCGVQILIDQQAVPVKPPVQSVCDMLGYDPYYLANEGRVVAVVATDQAQQALAAWRQHPQGRDAAIIGRIESGPPQVILQTPLGGQRLLDELEDDPLPRIC